MIGGVMLAALLLFVSGWNATSSSGNNPNYQQQNDQRRRPDLPDNGDNSLHDGTNNVGRAKPTRSKYHRHIVAGNVRMSILGVVRCNTLIGRRDVTDDRHSRVVDTNIHAQPRLIQRNSRWVIRTFLPNLEQYRNVWYLVEPVRVHNSTCLYLAISFHSGLSGARKLNCTDSPHMWIPSRNCT